MDNKPLKRILVLNVKQFNERRQFMQQQLAVQNLQASFVFDWDIDDLTDEILSRYFVEDNSLSPGQQSCALKHIVALQQAAAADGMVLVLEDDTYYFCLRKWRQISD